MTKFLPIVAIAISIVALVVSFGVFGIAKAPTAFQGVASCSGVSNCTAFNDMKINNLLSVDNITQTANSGITQSGAGAVNVFTGTTAMNGVIMSNATNVVLTTTSTLTTAQFCQAMQFQIQNTTATISVQPPPIAQINAATSSCPGTVAGGIQQNVWLNQSTNSVKFAAVSGFSFVYANVGATTTDGVALLTSVSSSSFVLSSSTQQGTAISFYGVRTTSSTYSILVTPYR